MKRGKNERCRGLKLKKRNEEKKGEDAILNSYSISIRKKEIEG